MSIREILTVLGVQEAITLVIGILVVLSTLVEISKIKINPWSALARWLGKKINAEVLDELSKVKAELGETKKTLDGHIDMDDRRTVDGQRASILNFNNELLRNIPHTKEEFIEVLTKIDAYEKYCKFHEDYKNNRAVLAIENIRETYRARLKKHDFLQESSASDMRGEAG